MALSPPAHLWRSYRYELIAVINGAIIMILEIVGARMIAPFFGTSTYVWTAVIGVILGALSLGYWYGGRLADQVATERILSLILLVAAGVLLMMHYARDSVLGAVSGLNTDLRLEALLAALILFAPANVLMGIVSPYLAKLKVTSLEKAGASIGGLYAAGTFGSILGTFAAGYWLIAWLGNRTLSAWLIVGLLVASAAVDWRSWRWQRLALLVAGGVTLLAAGRSGMSGTLLYDGDTAYGHYQVFETDSVPARRLLLGDNQSSQSGIYVGNPGVPAFAYIQMFVAAADLTKPKHVLLIGGGAFTLPGLLLARHPDILVDVVEIDPKLSDLAQQYFEFRPNDHVRIINEDGRTFLNHNQTKYDLIYMDAFSSLSPPFQLTTTEAVGRLKDGLTDQGAVIVNLISAREGRGARFGAAEQATYREHFEMVKIGPTNHSEPADSRQNLLMIAGRADGSVGKIAEAFKLNAVLPSGPVLTDDHAPVEQLTAP